MAVVSRPDTAPDSAASPGLQEMARRHLWMHFSRMGSYSPDHEIPIIVRGDGCYVYDDHGNRYLDGLSGLFCVNAGHGRTELAKAAARQMEELDFYTLWSYAHPPAIELATRLASLAPGDLNRVFFTSGGSESVESALKLVRNYHRVLGKGQKHKVIAREIAYHGTSLGALSATGITDGDVLQGVRYQGARSATTESLVMRSRSGTMRRIAAVHDRAKIRELKGSQSAA